MNELKELQRAEAFFEVVAPYLGDFFPSEYSLVEFCAGNGNIGRVFSDKGRIERVNFVDIKKVRGLEKTLKDLRCETEVNLDGVESYQIPRGDVATVAIHACGELTDKILRKSVAKGVPVAIMPCCYGRGPRGYSLVNPPDPRLLLYDCKEDYFDETRMRFLIESGYEARIERINPKITPMNRIIVGTPKKQTNQRISGGEK
ncbi:hypothetical protein HOC13_03370 [Candidatus Woesearchaeota archaeon]|jgi:hypothetical protein|nr:hypothetical protein [Candidatus Woesearchaeota archaeon]